MNNGLISKRYAKALMDYAAPKGEGKPLYERMLTLLEASMAVPQLLLRLQNPMVTASDKYSLLSNAMGGGKLENSSKKFAELLLANGRENLAQNVAVCYTALYRRMHRINSVQLTSAQALSDSVIARICKDTEKITGGEVELVSKINDNIGGGIIFQIDDLRYDGSVRGQLERIRKGLSSK